jgi:hypothetical protein
VLNEAKVLAIVLGFLAVMMFFRRMGGGEAVLLLALAAGLLAAIRVVRRLLSR